MLTDYIDDPPQYKKYTDVATKVLEPAIINSDNVKQSYNTAVQIGNKVAEV